MRVALLLTACTYLAEAFYPGNILALRVVPGTGIDSYPDDAAPVFIDEISLNGSLAQLPVPIPQNGSNACTLAGNATSEGQLSMSPNGANVALACYMAPVGTPGVVGLAVSRGAVVLNANGLLNPTLSMSNAYTDPPRHVHSAVVADSAINLYIGGEGDNVREGVGLSASQWNEAVTLTALCDGRSAACPTPPPMASPRTSSQRKTLARCLSSAESCTAPGRPSTGARCWGWASTSSAPSVSEAGEAAHDRYSLASLPV